MTNGFESYDTGSIIFPVYLNFLMTEGTWWSKFREIFPFPLYELFIINAPEAYYTSVSGKSPHQPKKPAAGLAKVLSYGNLNSLVTADSKINSRTYLAAPSALIARVNPLPLVIYTGTGTTPWTWDSSRWDNELVTYTTEPDGFFSSHVQYDTSEVGNMYIFNPKTVSALLGAGNAGLAGAVSTFGVMFDFASLFRYGYRPKITDCLWMTDLDGKSSVINQTSVGGGSLPQEFQTVFTEILSRIASYYEPTPNMLRGTVSMPLRPEIVPGNKLLYNPLKENSQAGNPNDDWLFYIEGLHHQYVFGKPSTTTLTISRGLRKSEYGNAKLMIALHTGTAQRINGNLTPITGKRGLTYFNGVEFNSQALLQNLPAPFSQLVKNFSTPGQPRPPGS
ncbi:MAG: hypothetical protein ACYCOU_12060 [Sulfobacillus sp.]